MSNILTAIKKAAIYLVVLLLICTPLTAAETGSRIYAADKTRSEIKATEPETQEAETADAAKTEVNKETDVSGETAEERAEAGLPAELSAVPAYEVPEFDQIEIPEIQNAKLDAENTLIAKRQEMDQDWLAAKEQEKAEAKAAEQAKASEKKTSGKETSSAQGSGEKIDLGKFKLTAYCPCYQCSQGWGARTSSGSTARAHHTIAVDNSVIPQGSRVLINGEEYVAEDVGGGVKGNHIDIFYDSHAAALNFGVRYAEVYLEK